MYAQLGDILFEGLIGFNSWARDIEAKYAKHELINSKPNEEHTGTELELIKWGIKFHVSFCKPEDEAQRLIDACKGAYIMPLIFGNGRVIGDFIIKKITENIAQTDSLGNITYADYNIELSEYYNPDFNAIKKDAAKINATSLSKNFPNIIRGLPNNYLSDGTKVSVGVRKAASEATEIERLINKANTIPELIARNSAKIVQGVDRLNHYLGDVNSILAGNSALTVLGPALPGSVSAVINAAINIKSAMPITSINSVLALNTTLQAATSQMKLDSAPIDAKSILRKI